MTRRLAKFQLLVAIIQGAAAVLLFAADIPAAGAIFVVASVAMLTSAYLGWRSTR